MSAGPYYDYSNELMYPSEIGIHRNGDIWSGADQIFRNAAGVQYYMDSIAFGTPTRSIMGNGPDFPQYPLGLNYFMKTGMSCSNGADMYQYMSTIPTGIPGEAGAGLKAVLGANLQGLAPGVIQDSYDGLNPVPVLNAVMGSGYPKCKLMEAPVGDASGKLSSRFPKPVYNMDPTGSDNPPIEVPNVWVNPGAEKVYYKPLPPSKDRYVPNGPQPHERRWVFDKWISQDEYYWTRSQMKKMGRLYSPGDIPDQNTPDDPPIPPQPTENQKKAALQARGTEGFASSAAEPGTSKIGAGILFAALFVGLAVFTIVRPK